MADHACTDCDSPYHRRCYAPARPVIHRRSTDRVLEALRVIEAGIALPEKYDDGTVRVAAAVLAGRRP